MRKICVGVFLLSSMISSLAAAPISKMISYTIAGEEFQGALVYDDSVHTRRPGLLMVPNWYGVTPLAIEKAKSMAASNYVVFVVDMYGKSVRPADDDAAMQAVKPLYTDREQMRTRVKEALVQLVAQTKTSPLDASKLAAVGFCFGGSAVLDLGRAGANVSAIITFHGNLTTDKPELAKNIKAKVLVLNGAEDKNVAPQIDAFQKEMHDAAVDWQLVNFGGAVHCFTETDAAKPGACMYNAVVARRAYGMMHQLLDEVFEKK